MEIKQIIEDVCKEYVQDEYAMYLRKSRADLEMEALGEGETLARHKHMLDALAAKHNISTEQITVYKEVVSGDSIQERPEMQRLLADVHQKKYKGVLVVEVERLARGNTKDQGEVAEAFQVSNTKIITPMKVYDPNNEFDQEYFEFGLFMSRREYTTIKRRLVAGKKQAVMEGNYLLPQRIFGYDIVKKSKKDRYLVPNPEEAKIVKMIFEWYAIERKSTVWIARQLTNMGIPTMKGNKEWHKGTVVDMLRNVHYIGMISWGRQGTAKVYDEKTGKLVKKRIYREPEVFPGKQEPIISKELFDLAQEVYQENYAPVKSNHAMRNPLASLMWCSSCGCHMAYNVYPDNRVPRYQHPTKVLCHKKSASYTAVIDAITESLKAYIEDFTFKLEHNNDQSELIKHQEMIDAMESELTKREKKRRKLFDDYEDGVYSRDEFIERKQHHTQIIDELKTQIKEAIQSTPAPVDYSEKITNLHTMIDCLHDDTWTAEEKNTVLKQYIERINYDIEDNGCRKGGKVILDVILK